jgi:hypothetical protein
LEVATAAPSSFGFAAVRTFLGPAGRWVESKAIEVQVADLRDSVDVRMRRAASDASPIQAMQTAIRTSTEAIGWRRYSAFMDSVLCGLPDPGDAPDIRTTRGPIDRRLRLPFPDTDAYRQLKVATEVFLMMNCGVDSDGDWIDKLTVSDIDEEGRRYGRKIGGRAEIDRLWDDLMNQSDPFPYTDENGALQTDGRTILYLALIRKKLGASVRASRRTTPGTGAEILNTDEIAVLCEDILLDKLTKPCFLELLWNYWHEEGALVQSMNSIAWRFQNRRANGGPDPLALVEIDPLRPLNNFIWGYIQDEQHRLTPIRRAYEYDHHYGVSLVRRTLPPVRGVDSRVRFLEAFHNLLYLCSIFFKEDDDTTIVADAFPILNALKEVHLQLTQGAHNQYGDLPWTARQEMLMEEWLLARPEFNEFLPRRVMVDYTEEWMGSVATLRSLIGDNGASILHFRDLGVFGEQLLLGIRFAAWPSVIEPVDAGNWARYWRAEIQGYVHAYRAVTSVDLTERPDATMPAILLQQRMANDLPSPRRATVSMVSRRRLPERVPPWSRSGGD